MAYYAAPAINKYALVKMECGWRIALVNIHNQIDPSAEQPGEHVPASSKE
jgi:hypothetical protein